MRQRNRWQGRVAMVMAVSMVWSALFAAVPPTSERGALVRVVTQWNEPEGDWHCEASSVGSWDDMVWGWYKDISDTRSTPKGHGGYAWVRDGFYKNGYIVDSNFTDPDEVWWGDDNGNDKADEPDVMMIALHGGGKDSRWVGAMRVNQWGDDGSTNNCSAWQGHMRFGDSDLEFLHLSSCFSMDEEDWYPNWAQSFDGVHQIDGFHGIMWISDSYASRYKNFSDDGFNTGLGVSWLDNLYKWRKSNENMCPVAMAVGDGANGQSEAFGRLHHERYNNVWSEPGTPSYYGVMYLQGCNPKDQPPLGSGPGAGPEAEGAGSGAGAIALSQRAGTGASPAGVTGGETQFPLLDRTAMTQSGYLLQADGLLPTWGATILGVADGADWMASLDVGSVAAAVGDSTPETVITDGPLTEARDLADTKVIKFDSDEGYVRFINRDRGFDWTNDPHTAWSIGDAQNDVFNALLQIGVPSAEIDSAAMRIDTLMGSDYQAGSTSSIPNSTHEAERWVTVDRRVNGLPVHESHVRGAVSNNGDIARMQIRWPRFTMSPGLVLRSRADVLSEVAASVWDAEFGAAVSMSIKLVYVKAGSNFIPAALVAFDDSLTGQELLVPLVETGPDADLDGVPDTDDNCPGIANPAQDDVDLDGVGDVCDNCPEIANPGQEDGDSAGIGDAVPDNPADGIGDACVIEETGCRYPDGSCETVDPATCSTESGTTYADTKVDSLLFTGASNLEWTPLDPMLPQRFALYRGSLTGAAWSYDHSCIESEILVPQAVEASVPLSGVGFYYLVTVKDDCGETLPGVDSSGIDRPAGESCP